MQSFVAQTTYANVLDLIDTTRGRRRPRFLTEEYLPSILILLRIFVFCAH